MEFLAGIRPVVPDHSSKESMDHANKTGEYLPLDPQPPVVNLDAPALVTADDAPSAAQLYVRHRGTRTTLPTKVVLFGPGQEIEVDLAATAAEAAPA